MPDVEECVSVFQTGLNHECDGEWREKLSLCSLSPVMHSAMGDEHGETETRAGSSWDPSLQEPSWGRKEKDTGEEPTVYVQDIHPGDGNGHAEC